MKIILLRHGTRNYTIGDIPLNDEGMAEAASLAKQSPLTEATKILSSPKKRAQMTVEPLAQELGVTIETLHELDQQQTHEDSREFKARVQTALNKLQEFDHGTVVACSHSDWLSYAMELIPSNLDHPGAVMFQCADFMTFEIRDGIWHKI